MCCVRFMQEPRESDVTRREGGGSQWLELDGLQRFQ